MPRTNSKNAHLATGKVVVRWYKNSLVCLIKTYSDTPKSCSWLCVLFLFLWHPGFSVEGPSQAKIECDDKGDGSCDVCYWPTEPGEYAVHVLCKNEDIQHSPFMVEIVPAPGKDFYPDKVTTARPRASYTVLVCAGAGVLTLICVNCQVKAYGPGLQSSGLAVGKPTEFTVDAKQGGKAPLKIMAQVGLIGPETR